MGSAAGKSTPRGVKVKNCPVGSNQMDGSKSAVFLNSGTKS